jgi:hypothetical protein
VLADEIYEHINYIGKHHSIAQEPGMKEQVVINLVRMANIISRMQPIQTGLTRYSRLVPDRTIT